MRRLVVFFVFMNFLLLGGGQNLNAGTHQISHLHYEHKHRIKFTNQDQGSSIIEEADVDLEEDSLGDNNFKDLFTKRLFATSYTLLDSWYLTFSDQAIAISYNHFDFLWSSYGQSNPIYITQRVLRI